MKKIKGKRIMLLFLLMSLCVMLVSSQAIGDQKILVYVDGTKVHFPDQQPYIDKNNRTLVPIRFVSETLNAGVDWNGKAKEVSIKDEVKVKDIKLWVNKKEYLLNGATKVMDTNAVLTKQARVVVPLRFVSEGLGAVVKWEKVLGNSVVYSFTLGQSEAEMQEIMDRVENEIKGIEPAPDTGNYPRPSELYTTTGKDIDFGRELTDHHFDQGLAEAKVMIITLDQLRKQPHQVNGTIIYDIREDEKATDWGADGRLLIKNKCPESVQCAKLFYIMDTGFQNVGSVIVPSKLGQIVEARRNISYSWENKTIKDIKYFGFWGDDVLYDLNEILLVENPEFKGGW